MRSDIQEKVAIFLEQYVPFTGERDVVYLLVEIRKILDHENNGRYPLLRFYADWSVHTDKDKITSQIRTIMEQIYSEIIEMRKSPNHIPLDSTMSSFSSMNQLKAEMHRFLSDHHLPIALTEGNSWTEMQSFLAMILADQPIVNPCNGIKRFSFKPGVNRGFMAEIEYEKVPAVYEVQTLKGAF